MTSELTALALSIAMAIAAGLVGCFVIMRRGHRCGHPPRGCPTPADRAGHDQRCRGAVRRQRRGPPAALNGAVTVREG